MAADFTLIFHDRLVRSVALGTAGLMLLVGFVASWIEGPSQPKRVVDERRNVPVVSLAPAFSLPPLTNGPVITVVTTVPPAAPPPTVPHLAPAPRRSTASTAVAFALAQVGRPYRAGAAGPTAYDCSGLTMAAYRAAGVTLPHFAAAQARLGEAVDWKATAIRPGDLVLTRGGRPRHDLGHVGLAVSATTWVVAAAPSTKVRVEPIPLGSVQAVRRLRPAREPPDAPT